MKKNKIDVLKGNGVLKAGRKVAVTDESGKTVEYTADKGLIIATGSRSRELPNLPQDGEKIIGYRQAMTLKTQPKKLLIVGSGAIGVEFAYFYNAIGTEVTVVEYLPNIVPVEDEDISKQLEKSFKKAGINIMTNSSVEAVDTKGKNCIVSIKTEKGEEKIECDVVLSAVGIQANIENIGLEELGIIIDKGRILVNDYYQTNLPGYYAIGDIVPGPALAHVASAEGIICVEKLAGHHPEPLNYGNIPGCTYCSPEIASVGMTEKASKAAGYDVKIGKFPFSASGKASAAGAKTAIMTAGDQKMRIIHDGERFDVTPEVVETVDPVGSGDAFVGGTIAGILGGLQIREAILQGSKCGALVASQLGDWTGLPYGTLGVSSQRLEKIS
jgi:dihydrolipoamide dehydrogenase